MNFPTRIAHLTGSALLTAALLSPVGFAAGDSTAQKATQKPDNTAVNYRDRSVMELTAQDQPNSERAAETTRRIRAELTTDSTLSTYAKNVKIIVIDNLITLKGPVNSDAERMKILKTAGNMAPGYKIENQIQVVR